MPPSGLLILNKPGGLTSRQATNVVARLARPARVGHAGTLDPLATGVLVVAVGAATRWIAYVQRMRKHYVGTFLLGRRSPTEDVEGEVVPLVNAPVPTAEQVMSAAARFLGWIDQRPPAFSAIKVEGRRAYALARQGRPIELPARPVDIHRIAIQRYVYPELILEIECGSGTYVRSLGRDLAESLGTAAVMSRLVRTAIGGFRLDEAVAPADLKADNWASRLLPPLRALENLPHVYVSPDDARRLRNGLTISLGAEPIAADDGTRPELVAVDPAGELVGVLMPGPEGRWRVARNMPTA